MAYVWMTGAIIYYLQWECGKENDFRNPPELTTYPMVSILVPCFNEQDNVVETLSALTQVTYPNFEIVAINDGSSDQTAELLNSFASNVDNCRIVHLASNQGKAMALRAGALVAAGEYFVCIDGDVLLEPTAVHWAISHFNSSSRVGAVTGNPRIRTRSTVLGKIQVAEFSALIGLIKRAQRVYGRVFTISGAVAAFRPSALQQVGYWDLDMITEDIDISWKLQLNHWDVRYEPNLLCWLLMPETLRGLLKQRIRWAQGGAEVALKNFSKLLSWRQRRMWPVFLEFSVSVLWAYVFLFCFAVSVVNLILNPGSISNPVNWFTGYTGMMLGATCLLQFVVSLKIDARYEPEGRHTYYWIIWYPFAYWLMNVVTVAIGLPKAIFKRKGKRAVWVSPDRGVQT